MRYYLETNAVRQLSRFLTQDSKIACALCYSSFMTVFELLSGMKTEFALRKTVLSNLLESQIAICWDTPREIIGEAFEAAFACDELRHTVRRMASLVIESERYCEANRKCRENAVKWALDDIAEADLMMAAHDQEEQEQKARAFRQDYDSTVIRAARDALIQSKQGSSYFEPSFQRTNEDVLLGQTAAIVAFFLPGPHSHNKLITVLKSYNGSLRWYLGACAFLQARNLLNGTSPALNDFFDRSHFLYIKSKSDFIVSDDGLIRQTCQALFPEQYVSVSEFKEITGWSNLA